MSEWKRLQKSLEEISPLKGGPGSGHYGHGGRPGQHGGSSPGTGGGDNKTPSRSPSKKPDFGSGKPPKGVVSSHHNQLVAAGFKYQGFESGGDDGNDGKSYQYYLHPTGAIAEADESGTVVRPTGSGKGIVFGASHDEKDMAQKLFAIDSRSTPRDPEKPVGEAGDKYGEPARRRRDPKNPEKPRTRHPSDYREIVDHD